ncbi:DnaJ domain-containing protein, partial [Pelagophyceae sp. CCMP2097]
YKTLGISVSADATAIKGAYRRLSLKFHPDKQKPELRDVATTVFAKIVAAYELLSNPVSRKNFDQ